ncbi:MAG: BrnA antitoxin family protein [Methylobacter sp.]|nr:BrnA antitoxin family protein [Methylobacter sp.]
MFLKTKSGRLVEVPTPEEEAVINAGIAADPDTYELTDEEFARLKPMRGRPVSANPKVHTGLRLDAEVLAAFKAGGPGWQTRINEALKEWLNSHSAA